MALSGVFVHGGSHNVVTNNVIFNVTSNGPQRGKWGYSTGGDFWIGQMRNSAPPQGNKISGNIVYSLDSHPSQHLIGNTTLWNPDLAQIDGNCYYNSAISFNSSLLSRLTPEVRVGTPPRWMLDESPHTAGPFHCMLSRCAAPAPC